ncbi:MAG: hypothetical protein ABRQ39_04155 [Candidatus Eremiobacterota bacterium]
MDSLKTSFPYNLPYNNIINTQITQPKVPFKAITPPAGQETTAPGDSTLSKEDLKKARLESLTTAQDKAIKNKRFKPRDGKTFCNEGLNSTLKQLGVPVEEAGVAHKSGCALTANVIAKNLAASAKEENGYWSEVDPKKAQEYANNGLPVVGTQANKKGHGHVATVRPGYEPSENPMINNIGKTNKVMRESNSFNNSVPVHYYVARNEANSVTL